MVQNGEKTSKVKAPRIKVEDVAAAAIFSAVGASAQEIVKNPTARWLCCVGIGICVGAYGARMVVDNIKGGEQDV